HHADVELVAALTQARRHAPEHVGLQGARDVGARDAEIGCALDVDVDRALLEALHAIDADVGDAGGRLHDLLDAPAEPCGRIEIVAADLGDETLALTAAHEPLQRVGRALAQA